MRWTDNYRVEGTDPQVTIGKATRRSKSGALIVGRTYHERFTVNGRQFFRSLKTGNKKVAVRRVFERQMNGFAKKSDAPAISIAQGLDEYLQVCRDRDLAPRSLQKYTLVVAQIKAALGGRAHAPVTTFDERDFWAFNRAMMEAELFRKTRYDRLIVLKQAMKYLARVRRIPHYPLDAVKLSKPGSRPQPCFTTEQVVALLAKADDYLRPIFTFLAYTGARFGEVRDILWTDLRLDRGAHGFVCIQRGGSRPDMPKDKESRLVPIHPELRKVLDALPRNGERVFHDGDGRSPLQQRKLLMSLKRLCAECGFADAKRFKVHSFRHFFCSTAARENLSYRYVLSWLGHSDSKIVEMYFSMFDDAAERAMASISLGARNVQTKVG